MLRLEETANIFQMAAHSAMGQKRKFSGIPYHTHPQAVLAILKENVPDATPIMKAATLLHDVLEDTAITPEELTEFFGPEVTALVVALTNQKRKWPDGKPMYTRTAQKRLDALRLAQQSNEAKIIKLCDRLHNLPDIIANDSKFAEVYIPETRYLLYNALKGAHDGLWNKLDAVIREYHANKA